MPAMPPQTPVAFAMATHNADAYGIYAVQSMAFLAIASV